MIFGELLIKTLPGPHVLTAWDALDALEPPPDPPSKERAGRIWNHFLGVAVAQ
mgnify:CR=1